MERIGQLEKQAGGPEMDAQKPHKISPAWWLGPEILILGNTVMYV